jgi:hypothetical protein
MSSAVVVHKDRSNIGLLQTRFATLRNTNGKSATHVGFER